MRRTFTLRCCVLALGPVLHEISHPLIGGAILRRVPRHHRFAEIGRVELRRGPSNLRPGTLIRL